jgi:hypothetical protein
MAIPVMEFQVQGWKIVKIFAKKTTYRKKFIEFLESGLWEVSKSGKIVLSKSIFYVKNHYNLSQFFSLKNTNLGAHFLLLTFFENINFKSFHILLK